jgi:hypothetical protein
MTIFAPNCRILAVFGTVQNLVTAEPLSSFLLVLVQRQCVPALLMTSGLAHGYSCTVRTLPDFAGRQWE